MTVVALGDSLTHGYGLRQEDGFVPQLQRWLDGRGVEAKIVNAGVSGDTTAGGLARVDWSLTPETDAMIVALGGNDMLRGIDPRISRGNLESILEIAGERGLPVLLAGLPAPGNYGPAYKRSFEAMYPELAEAHDAILVENFLAGVFDAPSRDPLMQPDGIHPNAEGVSRNVEAIGPKVLELIERARATGG